ncbi:hypothetical protein [Niveibacterium terrae]|uniref:hypothetical protein n=1 Tax=Niveibacterium terrae TaxID=3373598 RepID=UPI003A933639
MTENENEKTGKPFSYYIRVLHRDIGFLLIGLTLVFSLSGILLVYRPTGLLKFDTPVSRKIEPGLAPSDLGPALHLRQLEILGDDGRTVSFGGGRGLRDGKYDRASGAVSYTEKRLPAALDKLTELHKSNSHDPVHWFVVLYGVLLTFMAVSSFWMFKSTTRQFRRGLVLAAGGFVAAAVLVLVA